MIEIALGVFLGGILLIYRTQIFVGIAYILSLPFLILAGIFKFLTEILQEIKTEFLELIKFRKKLQTKIFWKDLGKYVIIRAYGYIKTFIYIIIVVITLVTIIELSYYVLIGLGLKP